MPLVALCGQTLGSLGSKMITVSQAGGGNQKMGPGDKENCKQDIFPPKWI